MKTLALVLALCGSALAQEKLKAGDKAPPIAVEKWVKGGPVDGFEKGKIAVVEFWATWCGPCRAMMPHLSAVQKAYREKGVTVVSINVWEDKEYGPETLKRVETFVQEQGDRMSYIVAFDGKAQTMATTYMKAAGQNGIPCAFIVDKAGTIAWIGHPMWLDLVLDGVVAGTWDPKTGAEKLAKVEERLNSVFQKMKEAPKDALKEWDALEREHPSLSAVMADGKFALLLAAEEFARAYEYAGKLADQAIADKDADKLNSIAWTIVDPEAKCAKRDLDLAMKAAEKADELTKHENAAILDTLARVHFLKGNLDKAIEVQTQAVAKAKGEMKDELQKSLDEYQAAKEKKK